MPRNAASLKGTKTINVTTTKQPILGQTLALPVRVIT